MRALFGSSDGGVSKYMLPPFPHPLPERSLALHCTPTGLLIVPVRSGEKVSPFRRHHSPRTSLCGSTEDVASDVKLARRESIPPVDGAHIGWGRTGKVKAASEADVKRLTSENSIHCYGVVGIQRLFNDAYLLVITARTLAGDYLDPSRPVYKSAGVLIIPLSYKKAQIVFSMESQRQKRAFLTTQRGASATSDDEEEDTEGDVITPSVISKAGFFDNEQLPSRQAFATVKAGKSGPWLQQGHARHASDGTTTEAQTPHLTEPPQNPTGSVPTAQEKPQLTSEERWHEATKAELEDKVVKETARQYSRGEMFFSYDFDLTTPLQRKQDSLVSKGKAKAASGPSRGPVQFLEPSPTLPLWRRADARFWHNEYMSKDFVESGLHNFVLPLMQGYYQVTSLPLTLDTASSTPSDSGVDAAGDAMDAVTEAVTGVQLEAQLLVISRRSKERAGLRYQRRGVNEKGQVANYVETEQILFIKRSDGEQHALSFVQLRGSIPQYWKQDPFSMKPPPILEGSVAENASACAKHFEAQVMRYGKVICIILAEQHGKEGAITKAYKDAVEGLKDERVRYKAFDFHEECKGMKFENVIKLVNELRDNELAEMDCFWKTVGGTSLTETVFSRQKSAFRVSCLDCLDRTNVVQSTFARYVLGVQLQRLGINRDEVKDEEFNFAFNDSWANNGDMVSRIYAGTPALKGDFVRQGKRNLMGMMNDATNSVYRMMQGALTDFFKQTVIDFQYGQMSLAVLERYNDQLQAQDPSEGHRLARVRANAIESCAREALSNEERKIAGWTLFSPIQPNRVVSPRLEEKVVLLTNKALYVCGFDFTTELLVEMSKIKLGDIVGLKRGVYILSPHEAYHPENHWGLIVDYLTEERRLNTSSMRNVPPKEAVPSATSFVAFRAVVDEFAAVANPISSNNSGNSNSKPAGRLIFSMRTTTTTTADDSDDQSPQTSHTLINSIVSALARQCAEAGACEPDDADFIKEETIQSLAQAKANAPMFGALIEGLKRRLWL